MSEVKREELRPRSRERKLRYAAGRQRATLYKSRLKDPNAYGYGRYWLVTHDGTRIGVDEQNFPVLTLDDVERLLNRGLAAAAA